MIVVAIKYILHLVFLMFIGMVIGHLLGHLSVLEKGKKLGDERNVGEASLRITVGLKMWFLGSLQYGHMFSSLWGPTKQQHEFMQQSYSTGLNAVRNSTCDLAALNKLIFDLGNACCRCSKVSSVK